MPLPTRCVDSSFDELTATEAACLREASWPVFWQCLWTAIEQPAPRVISLRNANAGGLLTAGYISLNSAGLGSAHVDKGRAGVPDDIWEALDFVAVDVELRGIRISQVMGAVERVEELGQKAVIYTSWNAWNNYLVEGGSRVASDANIPLVNALWDKNPDFDFPTLRYGGWKDDQVFMEQWSGGTYVCGQFVDRNTIVHPKLVYGDVFNEPTQSPQDMMKQLLTMNVPIYGATGPVTLYQLLHYGYHAAPKARVAKLIAAVGEARNTLNRHLIETNQSGGAIDRYSGQFLEKLADLLKELEEEIRNEATQ